MTPYHSQHSSQDASDGASLNLVLEHVLTYAGTYELPLRTMYAINATPQTAKSRPTTPTTQRTPTSPEAPADFQTSLLTQISKQRSQPCSLPPSFINSFLRKCFPQELELVDFPQSLTALDYMRDLESRRKREFSSALQRVGVSEELVRRTPGQIPIQNPAVAVWVKNMARSEIKIEGFYAKLYIVLRRWILVNELSLKPFNKQNCGAMLNTLYPPKLPGENQQEGQQLASILAPGALAAQRQGFFEWIRRVEQKGTEALNALMTYGKRDEDDNSWPATREILDEYLRTTNTLLDECMAINSADDINFDGTPRKSSKDSYESTVSRDSRGSRKADSGIGFGTSYNSNMSSKRPSISSGSDKYKDLPMQPQAAAPPSDYVYDIGRAKTGGSTLEKIAREVRRMRPPLNVTTDNPRLNPPRSPAMPQSRHSRDISDASSNGTRSGAEDVGRARGRGRSRSNASTAGNFIRRSLSRMRGRSRSRPGTAQSNYPREEERNDVPPTPSLPPPEMLSAFEDDDDENSGGKFWRSMSMTRSRSNSRGGVLRKMKSLGDTKAKGGLAGANEAFDPHEMKKQKEAWEARQRSRDDTGAPIGGVS